ncbi:hypothetical protein [Patulibacter defluvii]|uniref:hypothetical protein n=1 Tax=Patulibacter defluvii TaxID=3095358 RepID=UPI002A75BB6A|nr:hypothetical protein [Patulibacter sp. DM4]
MTTELAPPAVADPLVRSVAEGDDDHCAAVYLGFGLVTRQGVSVGRLPLDALAMVLVAARQRELRGAERVVHLIADRHALYGAQATRGRVAACARTVAGELRSLVAAFELEDYEVVLASEIGDRCYPRLLEQAWRACGDLYAARQAADVEWARRVHGAGVKVGWSMSADPTGAGPGRDEPHFDRIHREIFGDGMAVAYAWPGRALDPDRPRCPPYALLPDQPRLTFAADRAEIERHCRSSSMRRHLAPLADRALAQLGLPAEGHLTERLATLLDALRERGVDGGHGPLRAAG